MKTQIKEKTYLLIYEDKKGNELLTKTYKAFNIKDARKYRDKLFATSMLNDIFKIKVKLL